MDECCRRPYDNLLYYEIAFSFRDIFAEYFVSSRRRGDLGDGTGGVKVKTTVFWKLVNRTEQTFEETITQEIDDHGKKLGIIGKDIRRTIFLQKFSFLMRADRHFEFVGWWNNWNLDQPLEEAQKIDRPIALVRRT